MLKMSKKRYKEEDEYVNDEKSTNRYGSVRLRRSNFLEESRRLHQLNRERLADWAIMYPEDWDIMYPEDPPSLEYRRTEVDPDAYVRLAAMAYRGTIDDPIILE